MPASGVNEARQAGYLPIRIVEWLRDRAHRGTHDAPMDIIKTHYRAYGVPVEYAYTMVHKAAATTYPDYVALGSEAVGLEGTHVQAGTL